MYVLEQGIEGSVVLRERLGCPTVYLDHWALNDIALNDRLRNRFVTAISERGGTLRLSLINITEMMRQEDDSEIEAILALVDSVDASLINAHITEVIRLERELRYGNSGYYGNPSSLPEVIHCYLVASNWPDSVRVSELLRIVVGEAFTRQYEQNCKDRFDRLKRLVDTARADEQVVKRSRRTWNKGKQKGDAGMPPTRELARMLCALPVLNKEMKLTRNDFDDMFHAIVPVAYCDIVLLDKRWRAFVNQTGLQHPRVAMVFDSAGLEDFFETLENHDFLDRV